jgi:UDP-glucose 4-epimerase
MPIRLAITGSSGYLAQQLVQRLVGHPDCEFILGLDVRRREFPPGCATEFLAYDITSPVADLREILFRRRISTGLHLAWQFNPIHDARRQREVDLGGTLNFFHAAVGAGLRRVVYTSSTTAYVNQANPAQPPWLDESTTPTGSPRYLYSKHKGEADRLAQKFLAENSPMQFCILRPSIVLGPHTQNIVSKMMAWPWKSFPWMFQVRGADPCMQFISEEDIAEILFRAVTGDFVGLCNCAGDGAMRFSEIVRAGGKRPLPVPAFLLYRLTALLWKLRLSPFPAGTLDLIRYPWVADNSLLKNRFGYIPAHSSQDALQSFLGSRGGPGVR